MISISKGHGPRAQALGQDDVGVFFLITLLSLELVWFGFLSYDMGSCLMVGFLSYEWVLVL